MKSLLQEFKDINDLIDNLSLEKDKKVATRKLTEFYVQARFGENINNFDYYFCDGPDDGGIDFYFLDQNWAYVIQTKFSSKPKKTGWEEIKDELLKIVKTIKIGSNNPKLQNFLNKLKNGDITTLEIIWLTTNTLPRDTISQANEFLMTEFNERSDMEGLEVIFYPVDRNRLEVVLDDWQHGYIPNTGYKTLRFIRDQCFREAGHNIEAVCCTVQIHELLKWFTDKEDVDNYLQKNVREFLGDTRINRQIADSYRKEPTLFWYKHNGVIIFVDSLEVDSQNSLLKMRNPQVVNGGQTLKAVFNEYVKLKGQKVDNTDEAKILVRVYKLPYENPMTYETSIKVIAALNSQNQIKPSDLRSTDPRQVRIERLLRDVGKGYGYIRKRAKMSMFQKNLIDMRRLALIYYVLQKGKPDQGIRGNIEGIFSDDAKYEGVFNQTQIFKELTEQHIVYDYVLAWNLYQSLKIKLSERQKQFFKYTKWYVLCYLYKQMIEFRKKQGLSAKEFVNFVESEQFQNVVQSGGKKLVKIVTEKIPEKEDPKTYLRRKETVDRLLKILDKHGGFEKILKKYYQGFEKTRY